MKPVGEAGGFTLIEMLVVLTIIVIVSGLAAPLLSPALSHWELRSSATRLVVALREARLAAVSSGQKVRVRVHHDGIRRGDKAPPTHMSAAISFELSKSVGPNDGSITFFPHGGSTGGQIILRLAGQERTLAVEWLTGRVREI